MTNYSKGSVIWPSEGSTFLVHPHNEKMTDTTNSQFVEARSRAAELSVLALISNIAKVDCHWGQAKQHQVEN